MFIHFSWDSGPYSVHEETKATKPEIEGPGGYGTNVLPIPREIWQRYSEARDALDEAEKELDEAEDAALKEARAHDTRWKRRT